MCDMTPLYVLRATWLICMCDMPRQEHEGKKAALHAYLSSTPLKRTCSMCDLTSSYVLRVTWLISKRGIPQQEHQGKKAALHAHSSSMLLERTCSMMPRRKNTLRAG